MDPQVESPAEEIARLRREVGSLEARLVELTAELRRAHDESERESRLIANTIPGLVAILTPAGEVDVVNQELVEYCGQPLEAMREWGTNGTVHTEDLPRVAQLFTQAMTSGEPYDYEARIRRFDGVYRWCQIRGLPLRETSGHIARWYVLLTDVDDRRRAEDAIRASERNLKLIIDTIPAQAWSSHSDGRAEFLNETCLNFMGLSPGRVRDWDWTTVIHPDDLIGVMAWHQSTLASGAPGQTEARLRRYDGAFRWFLMRANPLRDETGNIVKWYGINTDIEDRKRAEDELRRNEAFLAEGLRVGSTGTYSWRWDTDEIVLSDELRRMYELAPDEASTFERLAAVIHPEDLPGLIERMEHIRATHSPYEHDQRLLMPDGRVKYLHTLGHVIQRRDGHFESVGATQDVTQRRLAEEAIDRLRSELAHVTRINNVGALTASIAHEVSQPILGIITNAKTCLRMLDSEPPNLVGARETAKRTIRDGDRASDIVLRLRAMFSKQDITPESMDLNEAAREVVALFLTELQRRQVVLQLEFAEDLPAITGDRLQLQQVIMNLIRNGSDAMVDVHDRSRHLLIRTDRDGDDRVRLSVRDAGVGLSPETLDSLFDAFYTTKRGGVGIGLFVSRTIVERHQGRLWAERNDGPGATFAFSIPYGDRG